MDQSAHIGPLTGHRVLDVSRIPAGRQFGQLFANPDAKPSRRRAPE
jgi:crotonobetainyl-CoA:carnitine CoA-transferase CaiB-like acyl-CoA transferase